MARKRISREEANRNALESLIRTRFSDEEVSNLRKEYAEGTKTIAEMSMSSECPPVMLWAILKPSYSGLQLQMLRRETAVLSCRDSGMSVSSTAKHLKLGVDDVLNYTEKRFNRAMFVLRPWYNYSPPKINSGDEFMFDETTLPPTARLSQTSSSLTDIPETIKGRCPSCGHIVSLPCLACRVREYKQQYGSGQTEETESERQEEHNNTPSGLLFV